MMIVNKIIRKEIIYSIVFIIIGIIASIFSVLNIYRDVMIGIAIGFLPTGIGLFVIYKHAKGNPQMIKNIEIEKEERNIFINMKAGYTAFWIMLWYIFVASMLGNIIEISFQVFGVTTIILMPTIYYILVCIFHKRY